MEKNRKYKKMREKEGRERVEISRDEKKKKRDE